jgi:hypothetical protein
MKNILISLFRKNPFVIIREPNAEATLSVMEIALPLLSTMLIWVVAVIQVGSQPKWEVVLSKVPGIAFTKLFFALMNKLLT